MTLNQDLVRARCEERGDSCKRLEQIRSSMTRERFLGDRDAQDIASYRLLVSIEAALGLCYHVSARQLKKVPQEYAGRFGILGEAGLMPADLSERMKKTARFRNLPVHLYGKVDYSAVYDILSGSLGDLRQLRGSSRV